MENDHRYVHFPLCLITELLKSNNYQNVLIEILELGIYNYSKHFQFEDRVAYKQVIYCYYRGELTTDLKNHLQRLYDKGDLLLDEDYSGFDGDSFEPYELDDFEEILKNNSQLRRLCLEFYQMDRAMDSLNLTGSIADIVRTSKQVLSRVQKHEAKYGKEPSVMFKKDLIFEFYKTNKSYDEIILLAAYAGIKSIIGNKDFTATTKKMIASRLIGAKSDKVLQDLLKSRLLSEIYNKYLKRYWFDKLINELLSRNFLQSKMAIPFGCKSRICLSCKLNYDELPLAVADYWENVNGAKKIREFKNKERKAKQLFNRLTTAP